MGEYIKRENIKKAGNRFWNWGTILYEESMAKNYREIIEEICVQTAISPLHDKDKWTEEDEKENPEHKAGELKKAHYHVVFHFDSTKSYEQAKEICDKLGAVSPKAISSLPGAVQYLWHMNNLDKEQYNKEDCQVFNGFQIEKYLPDMDWFEAYCQLIDYIEENDITHYSQLQRYIRKDKPELFKTTVSKSYAIVNYLKSRTHEKKLLTTSQIYDYI